jgi:mannose-6-phosphate isomerase
VNVVTMEPNRPRSFYRDSGAITAFRGSERLSEPDAFHPEDWIASTTSQFGRAPVGLSSLPDGRPLQEAIEEDPVAWLGPAHVARWGADPRLLVKLLDAGQRLPVHVHPDGAFAEAHLDSPYGKTEAWLILEASDDAAVHLGFRADVDADELARWRADEDTEALLAATNRIPVAVGDSILVPAGLPHAIGSGILLAELQEPSDFSIFIETRGFFERNSAEGSLGLPWDVALACVDREAVSAARIAELRSRRGSRAFPEEADAFFRADTIVPDPSVTLEPGYSVLIVLDGIGEATAERSSERTLLSRGQTVLVPYSAGPLTLTGDGLVLLRARPPAE